MRVLVLGGTAWLGGLVARTALARGHEVTCLARGSRPVPAGARLVRADRDRHDALAGVARTEWDAVIDVARQPGHVRRAVRELSARHWVFVSSASVYARGDVPEQGEDGELVEALAGDVMASVAEYGNAKVACEQAVREHCGSATIVRPGLVGGTGDDTGRSGYYPWRLAHPSGPDVLVPPDLGFPVALVDARDLAAWLVSCAEQRTRGTFNATGPTTTLGEVLQVAGTISGSTTPVRPVPAEVLRAQGVASWMGPRSLPLWIDDADSRWFATLDTTAARSWGFQTRPLDETLAAALAHEHVRTAPRRAGLTDADEQQLRAALG